MSFSLLVITTLQTYWTHVLVSLAVAKLLHNRFGKGISHIPGPFLASFSDLWLFIHYYRRQGLTERDLHNKYGSPLIRLGPNTVSVGDPVALKVVYGWKPILRKSRLYISQYVTAKDGTVLDNVSSTRDEKKHSVLRRAVANAYSLGTLVEYESLVDSTTRCFFEQLESRFVKTGEVCPLSRWVQMYAFDIIGELTFSKRFGFLEGGKDIDNMIYHTGKAMDYIGIMGQLPFLDEYVRLKGFGHILRKIRPTGPLMKFTSKQIDSHIATHNSTRPDFLTKFLKVRAKDPQLMTDQRLATYANTNVSAGSDTTAISLREVIFRILTHQGCLEKILTEIRILIQKRSSTGANEEELMNPITWSESQSMSYFQAVVKESLRIHPGLGQLIPRDVPQGGMVVCGQYLPGGTVVGCNAWTVHRDRSIFGHNADDFVPERWLECDQEKSRVMENAIFTFGAGSRVCLGKNIALLEISKLVPEFLRRFEVTLVDPSKYTLRPGWLVLQEGLDVKLEVRDQRVFL
ncbi:pisatin demethylase [Aspergillus eucalypticola CBS 122712]|uniref:Pisatin demethylase n=1 Tax=Aspergillus eucalypticola (strain CBS 122712 / IBT 29274) TaxID=1448314 RepID=A0A317UVI6_ASPEC|nr:pisatin demethylase [Aspergillus eucalypticola CBS 122712]PWY65419.1 pisatin demethylase [Aspergillus eucalypticola CBS 122712]